MKGLEQVSGVRVERQGRVDIETTGPLSDGRRYRCRYAVRFERPVRELSVETLVRGPGRRSRLIWSPRPLRMGRSRDRFGCPIERFDWSGPLAACELVVEGRLPERPPAATGPVLSGPTRGLIERLGVEIAREKAEAGGSGPGPCLVRARALRDRLLRDGVHARCVTGLAQGLPELHAWIELDGLDGLGVGYDPSKAAWVGDDYEALANADDGHDGTVVRGRFWPADVPADMAFSVEWF